MGRKYLFFNDQQRHKNEEEATERKHGGEVYGGRNREEFIKNRRERRNESFDSRKIQGGGVTCMCHVFV